MGETNLYLSGIKPCLLVNDASLAHRSMFPSASLFLLSVSSLPLLNLTAALGGDAHLKSDGPFSQSS